MKKEMNEILDELRRQGWRVVLGAHVKAYPPDESKPMVAMSSTPSDVRGLKNNIAQLRRSGFEWPPKLAKGTDEEHDDRWYEKEPEEKDALQLAEETSIKDALADSEPPEPSAEELVAPTETEDQRIDRLFKALREARDEHTLAKLEAESAKQRMREAMAAPLRADKACEQAAAQFAQAKGEFDAVVGAPPTTFIVAAHPSIDDGKPVLAIPVALPAAE